MSRKSLLVTGGLIVLVAAQALAVFLYLRSQPAAVCEREGGRWNATFQGCETIREASPSSSA